MAMQHRRRFVTCWRKHVLNILASPNARSWMQKVLFDVLLFEIGVPEELKFPMSQQNTISVSVRWNGLSAPFAANSDSFIRERPEPARHVALAVVTAPNNHARIHGFSRRQWALARDIPINIHVEDNPGEPLALSSGNTTEIDLHQLQRLRH